MRKRGLLIVAASLAIAAPACAQTAFGDWAGAMDVDGTTMRIVVHIDEGEDGAATGTADSPDQNVSGIPLGDVVQQGNRLTFSVPSVKGGFVGVWVDGAWVGEWRQGGGSLPLTLRPGTSAQPPAENAAAVLPANWSIPDDAAIGNLLEARIADRPGVGMVAGVLDGNDRRFVARGPGEGGTFTADSLFETGSLTKLFTGLLLADMSLRGEVSLDDPAQMYLPQGATMPQRGERPITLRDLAMHVSGLPRLPNNMPYGDPADPYSDYTEDDLLAFLSDYELPREVGSQFEYSNLGVGLLGYLLQRASGQDYATLLRERITGPLGMDDTVITLTPEQQQRLAPAMDAYLRPTSLWHFSVLTGAGGIMSTADDLLVFANAMIDPQSPIAAPVQATLGPRIAMDGQTDVAIGWFVAKTGDGEVLFHGGGTGGYRTAITIDREAGEAAVVLANAAIEPATDDMAFHLLTGRPLAATTPPSAAPPDRVAIRLAGDQLARVTGTYEFSPEMVLRVTRKGDGLLAQLSGQPAFQIFASAPLEFFWRVVDARVRFLTDDAGNVTGALLMQNGAELAARRTGPAQ